MLAAITALLSPAAGGASFVWIRARFGEGHNWNPDEEAAVEEEEEEEIDMNMGGLFEDDY